MKNPRPDNPYKRALEEYYNDSDEPMLLNPEPVQYVPANNDIYHLVSEYETLDTLAFNYYGNSKYWWVIAHANNILNPFDLYPAPITIQSIFTDLRIGLISKGVYVLGPMESTENYLKQIINEDTIQQPELRGLTLIIPNLPDYQIFY
jgi:hypothetical protein